MDIDIRLALHSAQQHPIPQQVETILVQTYEVVWSGEREKQAHDAQTRPAPQLPGAQGSTGKARMRMDGQRRSEEDNRVIDLRTRWQVPTKP
jgi:hypothetical protein